MHFAYTTSTSTAFQHLDGIRPETSVFPYPSTDFELESSVHQDAFKDTNTSPVTSIYDSDDSSEVKVVKKCQVVEISFDDELDNPRYTSAENIDCLTGCLASVPGQMQYAGESHTPGQASDHYFEAYPITTFQKSLTEFYHQENELLSYRGIHHKCLNDCPKPDAGKMLEVPDSECPTRMLEPADNADLFDTIKEITCSRMELNLYQNQIAQKG